MWCRSGCRNTWRARVCVGEGPKFGCWMRVRGERDGRPRLATVQSGFQTQQPSGHGEKQQGRLRAIQTHTKRYKTPPYQITQRQKRQFRTRLTTLPAYLRRLLLTPLRRRHVTRRKRRGPRRRGRRETADPHGPADVPGSGWARQGRESVPGKCRAAARCDEMRRCKKLTAFAVRSTHRPCPPPFTHLVACLSPTPSSTRRLSSPQYMSNLPRPSEPTRRETRAADLQLEYLDFMRKSPYWPVATQRKVKGEQEMTGEDYVPAPCTHSRGSIQS